MDDAFCWWRWAEARGTPPQPPSPSPGSNHWPIHTTPLPNQYSVSASLMAMAIGITLGIREQNALAAIFMLHWATMAFGFLVESVHAHRIRVCARSHTGMRAHSLTRA